MAPLYIFKGRTVGGISYDEANDLDNVSSEDWPWYLSPKLAQSENPWGAANAPQAVKQYQQFERSIGGPISEVSECAFCNSATSEFGLEEVYYTNPDSGDEIRGATKILICYQCGWYRTQRAHWLTLLAAPSVDAEIASLQQCDIQSASIPLEELRAHLARHWGDRRHISAAQAEAVVADVFREHLDGEVLYTTNGVYCPDGGVDFVIVQSASGIASAFQVKRRLTDSPERVTEVRSFLGALAGSPFPSGYFVTTAPCFTRATIAEKKKIEANLQQRKITLEIVDGTALHRILRSVSRRPSFEALSEFVGDRGRMGRWIATRGEAAGQTMSFGDIVAG